MSDILEKLDNKNIQLVSKVIANAKDSMDVYRIILLNQEAIIEKGGSHFFGHLKRIETQHFALELCKIFEAERRHELYSIPSIIQYITSNTPPVKVSEAISKFITKYGNIAETINEVYSQFRTHHQNDIDRIKKVRNKLIAHAEDTQISAKLPSYDICEALLSFSIDFYSMVSEAYIGTGPVNFEDRTQLTESLVSLLNNIGIEKVEREFS